MSRLLTVLMVALIGLELCSVAVADDVTFRGCVIGKELATEGFKETSASKKENGDFKVYTRESDEMKIGEIGLKSIVYTTYKGRLYRVDVRYERLIARGSETVFSHDIMETTLGSIYGATTGYDDKMKATLRKSGRAEIANGDNCVLSYTDIILRAQIESAGGNDAVDDLQ